MAFDIQMIETVYANFSEKVAQASKLTGRPLTMTEKVLYAHLINMPSEPGKRGVDYMNFQPDRVAMQDATAQMALLQFMHAGKDRAAVPSTVHCDHLIVADEGAEKDLICGKEMNKEVYDFLSSVAKKYGIGFWGPGAGIIHQVLLENYVFPGGMMIGTDSHTVNAGGLGMIAIGVGGADAVDVMAGMPWELKLPKLIGVHLKGSLKGWTSSKDIILKIAEILTVKGGTGCILEYFGEGAENISCTGKATVCNMGAEVGATTSVFGYDDKMAEYLRATNRQDVADQADKIKKDLTADPEVYENPEKWFDQVIEIDLDQLEPYLNGPFSPDRAWPVSSFAQAVKENNYPEQLSASLIGSCTNSSYEDISRAVSIIVQAKEKGLPLRSEYIITPGSEMIRKKIEEDGLLKVFEDAGAKVVANACGPCIGQWKRSDVKEGTPNSIITSFNRNFAKRNDGNPHTHAFVGSPEMATIYAIAGNLLFNPLNDELVNEQGQKVRIDPPEGKELPSGGFEIQSEGYQAPASGEQVDIKVNPESERIQLLEPFDEWDGEDLKGLKLLIKAKGKCTTDHISMAGPWLKYRGHLENISNNLLIGAENYFNERTNYVKNALTGEYMPVPEAAESYKKAGYGSVIVADENYGEGSSREHAAMEPRFMGVRAVIARSFARIHETNLKKQGILALTFSDKSDYDKILEDDTIDIKGVNEFSPGQPLTILLHHVDETKDEIKANHTYNENQIEWFKSGSALNMIRKMNQ